MHDMGGRTEFFGPVVEEADEPVFHEPWEGRVFGLSMFLMPLLGRNVDAFRFAQERPPRDVYLSGSARMSFPIRTPSVVGEDRSTSTPSPSKRLICGGTARSRAPRCG
ncbi:MAG TPA: hypothetical protein VF874_06650 [Mycobacterium sp.]